MYAIIYHIPHPQGDKGFFLKFHGEPWSGRFYNSEYPGQWATGAGDFLSRAMVSLDFPLFLVEFMPLARHLGLRQRFKICISHPTNLMMLIPGSSWLLWNDRLDLMALRRVVRLIEGH